MLKLILCFAFFSNISIYSVPGAVSSHPYSLNDNDTFSRFYSTKRYVKVPFKFISNLIIIPLRINNSDTLNFILDTGLNTTIITELMLGETLSLNYADEIELHGLGEGAPLQAYHSRFNDIFIEDIKGINQDLYVLKENIFHLSTKLGYPVHGILGYDIFNHFVVEINYDRNFLVFHDPLQYKYKKQKRNETRLPLYISKSKTYINVEIVQNDGNKIKTKLLLDTGASHSLWLNIQSHPLLKIPEKTIRNYLGSGLNGDIYGRIGRLQQLQIGKNILKDVIISYPDSIAIVNALGLDERNGSMGGEILKRFNIVMDYDNKLISLRKNDFFDFEFNYNMSGIEIIAPFPGVNYYKIYQIREGSPAEKAGLKVGDEIFAVNNKPADKLSLNEITDLFRKKKGKKIKLIVYRGDEKLKCEFYLEKLI